MAEGTMGNDPTNQSALKLATATTNMPMGIDDWAIETIESVPVPVPLCNGGCGSGKACVDLGNGPGCVDTTVGCGSCESGESCVENMGMKECVARISITKSDDLFEVQVYSRQWWLHLLVLQRLPITTASIEGLISSRNWYGDLPNNDLGCKRPDGSIG